MKEILVKSVLNKKKKRDDWFLDDYTVNPYEGCSFNCQYCYVRGSKYGENMEETLAIKVNAPQILEKQLAFRVKKNQYGLIALASATDPYLKIEQRYRLTESFLHLILKYHFPVLIITKSDLILRDLELLKRIDKEAIHAEDLRYRMDAGTLVSFSFSTLDERIANTLEPGAPPPLQRLETLKRCKEAGLKAGVNLIPILPFINDSEEELEKVICAFKNAGADYVLGGGLTLFGNGRADSKTLYFKFLERNFPKLVPEYKKLYRIFFFPPKEYTVQLAQKLSRLCEKYKISDRIVKV